MSTDIDAASNLVESTLKAYKDACCIHDAAEIALKLAWRNCDITEEHYEDARSALRAITTKKDR